MRFYLNLFVCISCLLCLPAVLFSQTPKEDYESAKKEFEIGNIEQCLALLEQCEAGLGGSNGRIESIRCQALVMKNDWINAAISYNNYEQLLPPSAQNGEAYFFMLDLKKTIWIELAEIDKREQEKMEKEMQDDLAQAEAQEAAEQAAMDATEKQQDDENEKKLYDIAMKSKDEELLEVYKKEIGASTANGKKIATEIDKKGNPNAYIVAATENGDTKEVSYLVELGADKNKTNSKGDNLLHIAVGKKDNTMLAHLIGLGAAIEAHNSTGETPLQACIKNDFYSGVVTLLDKKADAKAISGTGKSSIYYCLIYKRPLMIKQLVKYGADVNTMVTENAIRMTPLYYAVFILKDQAMVMAILSAGARVNDASHTGWTPLIAAVYLADIAMIKLLLTNDADINTKGPYNWTAMHFAVRQHNIEIINLLVKGADKNAVDNWQRTPLKIAKERRYKDVIKILKAG